MQVVFASKTHTGVQYTFGVRTLGCQVLQVHAVAGGLHFTPYGGRPA
jgi:hypothetical protein